MIKTIVVSLSLSVALLGACGGAEVGPQPLRYYLDDMYIAQVPIESKREVLEAQQAYAVAKMEYARAVADYDEAGTRLDVAKNQQKQALLEEQSAQRKLNAAENKGDLNRINVAKRELRATELARKAIDEKVAYAKAMRRYLKKHVRTTQEEMYHQEARFELSKAKVARQNNIRPRDFEYQRYEQQVRERSRRSQEAKAVSKREKGAADERRKRWKALEKQAERMRGGTAASKDNDL